MRPPWRILIAAALLAFVAGARGAPNERRPYIGYLYAAGGGQGDTVKVVAGGQNLRGVRAVYVSGEGVTGRIVKHRPARRVNNDQMREIRKRVSLRVRELTKPPKPERRNRKGRRRKPPAKPPAKPAGKPDRAAKADQAKEKPVELPDHPLVNRIGEMDLREIRKVAEYFFDPTSRLQMNSQIGERVELEIAIDPDAAPGYREIRLVTPQGLTNAMRFEVGLLPEAVEQEPNDFETRFQETADLPLVLNGQVDRKDIDRFRFRALKGQKLVIEAHARRLVPYLADAVPGWFQATLALRDADGREIRFADDHRFDPDPVMLFTVPENGEYVLEIRDAIHRGRADFVYRITVAERPFITSLFPLGGKTGAPVTAEVTGWNLPWKWVPLDTDPGARIRETAWRGDVGLTNLVQYAVDDLADCREEEPNDTRGSAQAVSLPLIVNGRVSSPGDVDVFCFTGKAGEEIVAEVNGRRLASSLDSLLTLTDSRGVVVAWNDDTPDKEAGLVTHHADSYLLATLPADGTYCVHLKDTQHRGGPDFAYRLRVGAPRPDFSVIVTPSALNIAAGSRVPVTVHAVRKDGFTGDIKLELKGAPGGLTMSGGWIPRGRDKVRMTISAARGMRKRQFPLTIVAHARIGDEMVTRTVIPAEDQMQAFGLRHLVRTEELLVCLKKARGAGKGVRVAGAGPSRLPVGGTAAVRIVAPGIPRATMATLDFELSEPPAGLKLKDVGFEPSGIVLFLGAEGEAAKSGYADNLIVEVYVRYPAREQKGRDGKMRNIPAGRWYAGVLPAIPFVLVPK